MGGNNGSICGKHDGFFCIKSLLSVADGSHQSSQSGNSFPSARNRLPQSNTGGSFLYLLKET